jgi:hypothetical protein
MKPQYRPLQFLPTLATHIDGMLAAHQEQYATLLQAKDRPHVLDDYTVQRVIKAYTTAKNDLPLFDEQLRRWSAEKVTTAQRQEIIRLKSQMQQLHEVIDNVLKLANRLAKGTIEQQLAKSDEQLGLEYLRRMQRKEK